MKTLSLIAALSLASLVWSEDVEALKAQKAAASKEVSEFRQAYIKATPDLAAQKAAIDEQTKKLYATADEALKDDAKYKELRDKLRAVSAELKKAEAPK